MITVNAAPVTMGISTLSLTGKGKTSTVIAIAAPIKAKIGGTQKQPAKNAKKNPHSEPSQVLPLLKGSEVEISPPVSEATLSPKQNIATAA